MEGQTGPFEMYKGNFPSRSQKGQFSFSLKGKLTPLKKEGFPFGRAYNKTKANPSRTGKKCRRAKGCRRNVAGGEGGTQPWDVNCFMNNL